MDKEKIKIRSERYYNIVVPITAKFVEEYGHELTEEYGETLLPNTCEALAALGFTQDIVLLEKGRNSGYSRATYNKHLKEWYIIGTIDTGPISQLLGLNKKLPISTVKAYKANPEYNESFEKAFPYIMMPELEKLFNEALGLESIYESQMKTAKGMEERMVENTEVFNAEVDINHVKSEVESMMEEWSQS